MAKGQRDLKRETYWRGVLRRFGKSGLSVRGFCGRERLSEPSFYSWRRVIKERDRESRRRSRPAFVPVVVRGEAVGDVGADIRIELRAGRVLRLPVAMSAGRVAELVHALEAGATPAEVRP